MANLSKLCDRYILNGSPKIRERVFNVLDQIATEAVDEALIRQSIRTVKRAGVPMHKTYLERYQHDGGASENELGRNDTEQRRQEADRRKEWERRQQQRNSSTSQVGDAVAKTMEGDGISALSRRVAGNGGRPDLFMPSVLDANSIATIANDKRELQQEMVAPGGLSGDANGMDHASLSPAAKEAACRVSDCIAKAGSGLAFDGETLGIGGLDDVLLEIKRRIWTPLAAPPQLLKELGIHPVRGLLLYGKPGCGKSLLASTLGRLLSPLRPITVVSGPEIMDKFVGSSEKVS
jgi:ATP-dependent 26S proteasome regulatory subunit